MEKKELITRYAPDRRSLCVYLTEKGKALVPLIEKEFLSIEDKATSGFSEREKEMLIDLLLRISVNLG